MIESSPQIRRSGAEFEALVDRTAEALGIDAAFVEKDFWVIEALRIATSTAASHEVRAIFKGGTSLSRAFGIIQRFSEDVDLLLDFPEGMAKGARDRTIKAIGENVRRHFGIGMEKIKEDSARTGVKRNFRLYYPSAKSADAITEGIYLEIGSRGGPTPSRDVPIRSMIADHAIKNMNLAVSEYEEFAPVLAHVLAPERTLIEKIALLAAAGDKFDTVMPMRSPSTGATCMTSRVYSGASTSPSRCQTWGRLVSLSWRRTFTNEACSHSGIVCRNRMLATSAIQSFRMPPVPTTRFGRHTDQPSSSSSGRGRSSRSAWQPSSVPHIICNLGGHSADQLSAPRTVPRKGEPLIRSTPPAASDPTRW